MPTARFALRYNLIMDVADRVAALAETNVGSDAKERWMDRVHATLFARLCRERCLDKVPRWISERGDMTDEQREYVSDVFNDYVHERRIKRAAAIRVTARMSSSHYFPDPLDLEPIDRAWGRSLLELHRLSKRTAQRIAFVLTAGQLHSFHEDVLGVMTPLKYGPEVFQPVLASLDAEAEYAEPPLRNTPDLLPDVIRQQRKQGLFHPDP